MKSVACDCDKVLERNPETRRVYHGSFESHPVAQIRNFEAPVVFDGPVVDGCEVGPIDRPF